MDTHAIALRQAGLSKYTVIFFGLLIGVTTFCAYQILPFYYYYFEIENQMISLTTVASTHTDKEIRRKLMYHIKKLGIPIEEGDIEIARIGDRIQMRLEYDEIFYITWRGKDYDLHTFEFEVFVDEVAL